MNKTFRIVTLALVALCGCSSIIAQSEWRVIDSWLPLTDQIENCYTIACETGDLNGDGKEDLVEVCQFMKDERLSKKEILNPEDATGRILRIFFCREDGSYDLFAKLDSFILFQDGSAIDEPFEELTITNKGVLEIGFFTFTYVGAGPIARDIYKFRFQNESFELIGYEGIELDRFTLEAKKFSLNFSTRKMSVSASNYQNDDPPKVEWRTFTLKKLKSIRDLKKPFQWEFQGLFL